jgi:hypothetical protein
VSQKWPFDKLRANGSHSEPIILSGTESKDPYCNKHLETDRRPTNLCTPSALRNCFEIVTKYPTNQTKAPPKEIASGSGRMCPVLQFWCMRVCSGVREALGIARNRAPGTGYLERAGGTAQKGTYL